MTKSVFDVNGMATSSYDQTEIDPRMCALAKVLQAVLKHWDLPVPKIIHNHKGNLYVFFKEYPLLNDKGKQAIAEHVTACWRLFGEEEVNFAASYQIAGFWKKDQTDDIAKLPIFESAWDFLPPNMNRIP